MMSDSKSMPRAVVMSKNGMVATAHPLATAAGIDILQRGGNAMDAAIAAALTTGVTMPQMCGLGGDIFLLHYDGSSGAVTALLGSGVAPELANRDYFVERGYEKMPFSGPLSIAVPGAVQGYFDAIERFGSMPAQTLFRAAIRYAAEGFPVTNILHLAIARGADGMREYPSTASVLLPGGEAPNPGSILRQPDLARTLQSLAENGPDIFYRGALAEEMGRFLEQNGGILRAADLANHQSEIGAPIQTDYRGFTVFETGLPSHGLILLQELNILENADLSRLGAGTADAIHLMAETKKRAVADRLAYAGDPKFVETPLETLLSKEFARARYESIDMQRASDDVPAGAIDGSDGNTTYLCVVDRDGNAVSLIHSVSSTFGSRVIAGSTGVLLNNRVGRGFTLEADHPNVIRPGKRTMHTLNCYLVTENGRLRWVGATPGGDLQPQVNMQILTNLIDFGMNVQQAIEAPRWSSFPSTDPANLPNDFVLNIEGRAGEGVIGELERRGHRVNVLGDWAGRGDVQLIEVDAENGVLLGGTDPRREGIVLGF
jgi:gamma-glutamyltranspeptidase / glutathione hydrolase